MDRYVRVDLTLFVRTDWHPGSVAKYVDEITYSRLAEALSNMFPFSHIVDAMGQRVPLESLPKAAQEEVEELERFVEEEG